MNWSHAEILALATKAARGAGAPAGQAQRFGQAAVMHLSREGDPGELLQALATLPEGIIVAAPREIDMQLADSSGDVVTIATDATGTVFDSYIFALLFATERLQQGNGVVYRVNCAAPARSHAQGRLKADDNLIARFRQLAQATLVPDSVSSRSSGAGAGLDDND